MDWGLDDLVFLGQDLNFEDYTVKEDFLVLVV